MPEALAKPSLAFVPLVLAVSGLGGWAWTAIARDPNVDRAVWVAAIAAAAAQLASFGVVRVLLLRRVSLFGAWGAGMAVRFVALVVFALLATKAWGLALGPALVSFVLFVFVTTVVEPVFLRV